MGIQQKLIQEITLCDCSVSVFDLIPKSLIDYVLHGLHKELFSFSKEKTYFPMPPIPHPDNKQVNWCEVKTMHLVQLSTNELEVCIAH